MRILRSLLLMCAVAAAQVKHPAGIDVTGPLDAPTATRLRLKQAASDPATCVASPTEFYWNTATNRLRYCSATNVWSDVPAGGSGDVVGPASAVSGNAASFNGTTGKLIQDSGKALPSGSIVGTTDTQTLTNKTLTTPIITSYTVAGLPAATTAGQLAVVTDAATSGSCTSGGGSAYALCRATGSVWQPVGDGRSKSYWVQTIPVGINASGSNSGVSYCGFGFNSCSNAFFQRTVVAPGPGTMRNFYLHTDSTQGADGNLVCTWRKNDVAQTLSVTIPISAAAGLFSDTTNSFSFDAGDFLSLRCLNSSATLSTLRTYSVVVDN